MRRPCLARECDLLWAADGFAVGAARCTQYKISKIKFAISIIAITPATESTKACITSWWPATLSVFMANLPLKSSGSRDPDTTG